MAHQNIKDINRRKILCHLGQTDCESEYSHLVYSLLQTANKATSRLAVLLHTIICDGTTCCTVVGRHEFDFLVRVTSIK